MFNTFDWCKGVGWYIIIVDYGVKCWCHYPYIDGENIKTDLKLGCGSGYKVYDAFWGRIHK